ncbi:MAG: type IV secretion system DNA-binding domain-containing protein [Candidatus Paceibacterota bacterium]|nr:MAG: type IV secretion system DNA-binding domain-containing protein [Candidatus Paceibacterota bacterium]
MALPPENPVVLFGQTTFRNELRPFGIKMDDRRRHMYVIGKTGMGKSELLKNLAIQDIRDGRGIAFIDPHGDPVEDLLDFIPAHRVKDVIYFNPADLEHPIGFNIMEHVSFDNRHLVADGMMAVFKKLWVDQWSARMEYILNNTILALLEAPGSTLLGINRMLADKAYRKSVVDQVTDTEVKAFWTQEFAKYNERYAGEATAAIQNKIGQFVSNPLIRNIVGQEKSAFDMRKAMDEGKIVLVNISKGRVGEDASRLLGAMLITKIQLAAMSRVDIAKNERNDFILVVDEFQNFATASFANILSEARKFNLSLVIANQYIAQMEDAVRDAVFGNVGTIISFRVGAEDAEMLEKEFAPEFVAQDIVNLGKRQIYLKLMIDGVASKAFSAMTMDTLPPEETTERFNAIEASRKTFGRPRAEVEKTIGDWREAGVARDDHASEGHSSAREQSAGPRRSQGDRPPRRSRGGGGGRGGSQSERPAPSGKITVSVGGKELSLAEAMRQGVMPFTSQKTGPGQPQEPRQHMNNEELRKVLAVALGKEEAVASTADER